MKAGVAATFHSLWVVLLGALLVAGAAWAQHPTRVDPLEQRVQLLTHELDLNLEQRNAVRQILQEQREAVQHIWRDPAIDPAERAPAVRLLGEHTAERIRAVLNEDQKKKYNKAMPGGALSTRANVDVEGWLRAARGQTSENPLGVPLPNH